MAIIERLTIGETVTEGAVRTCRAVDQSNGGKLLIHYGDFGLLEIADRLGGTVLESGQSGEHLYLLTPDRPDLENLNEQPSTESAGPGEFTRMFQVPVVPKPPLAEPVKEPPPAAKPDSDFGFTGMFSAMNRISVDPPAPKPEPVKPEPVKPEPAKPEPAKPAASEFTSFFKAPPAPLPPPREPAEEPQRARPVDHGEFTRMFNADLLKAPVAKPPIAPPPAVEDGAFTRMFEAAPVQKPRVEPSLPLPPKPEPVSGADEFTRFFQNPLPASKEPDWNSVNAQAPGAPAAKSEGDFTRMFGRSGAPAAPEAKTPASAGTDDLFDKPRSAPAPAPARSSGAKQSDGFTQRFNAPKAPTAPAPPPIVPVTVPGKKPPAVLLVVIVLAIVVLAGCAIYYFVFKGK